MTPLATPLRWHAFAKRFNALPGDYAAIAIRLAWAYASVHVLGNVVHATISTEVDNVPALFDTTHTGDWPTRATAGPTPRGSSYIFPGHSHLAMRGELS